MPDDGSPAKRFDAQTPPLGIDRVDMSYLNPTTHDVSNAALCIVTDGIREAETGGRELGLGGLAALLQRMPDRTPRQKLDGVMRLFGNGRLQTHDDATLLIVTANGQAVA